MRQWFGFTISGFIVGAIAVWIVAVTVAGGHGSYVPAAILFPFSMAPSVAIGYVPTILIIVGLAQYPLYGVFAAYRGASRSKFLWLGGIHTIAACAAYVAVVRSSNFG
jgi:hypothetical protein